ncbi:MAG: type II secretion system protein M [Sedimentisphaerales bacterium]|nr:type II secretion system protein M [Sedimentisphaerales bacterium]
MGIGALAIIAVWALYGFAIKPTQERIRTLERIIPDKQTELAQLRDKSAEYLTLRREFEDIQRRIADQDPTFELLSFLESLIARHRLDAHLGGMKGDPAPAQPGYAETSVTIELKGVSLAQLVRFLAAVESAEVVARVDTLHIRKDPNNSALLASTIQIVNPRPTPTTASAGSF